jgi:hypothetical protein
VNVGSISPSPRPRALWASARTILVLAGLGFVTASLVAACLDHYEESFGCEAAAVAAGSGEGSAAVPAGADCGATAASEGDAGEPVGSGSGAATAP